MPAPLGTSRVYTIRTPEIREAFLSLLAEGVIPKHAAADMGLGDRAFYNWRKDDPDFRMDWDIISNAKGDRLFNQLTRTIFGENDEAPVKYEFGAAPLAKFIIESLNPRQYNSRVSAEVFKKQIELEALAEAERRAGENAGQDREAAISLLDKLAAQKQAG